MDYKKFARTVSLLTCGVISSIAWAETGSSLSKERPVASPNRTPFSSLAATSKTTIKPGNNHSAILVVDSTGKTIGRFMHGTLGLSVLMSYNNQPMQAGPLGPDTDFPTGQLLSYGLNWVPQVGPNVDPNIFSAFYTSGDCSGTPVFLSSPFAGTRYAAIAVSDTWPPIRSSVYLAVTDALDTTYATINSRFYQGQCYSTVFSNWVLKVIGVAPASTIGTPPYFLK